MGGGCREKGEGRRGLREGEWLWCGVRCWVREGVVWRTSGFKAWIGGRASVLACKVQSGWALLSCADAGRLGSEESLCPCGILLQQTAGGLL